MPALKYLLMVLGVALFGSAGALVAYDIYLSEQLPAADSVRHPDGADHGRLRDDSRRRGGHTRQRVLGRALRYVIQRKEILAARNGCANGFR